MSADLLQLLLETALAASGATLLVLGLRLPARRAFGARAAYALWLLVPAALLAVLLPSPRTGVALPMLDAGALVLGAPPAPGAVASAPSGLAPWLALAWAIGALALAGRLALRQRRFRHALGELRAQPDGSWRAQSASAGPAVIGAMRGRVVLPADFDTRYTAVQRDLVLRHERVHVARYDLSANLAATLLRCLHWFNPLLHYAFARFRFDQELAADALVLAQRPGARREYAEAMLRTQLLNDPPPLGCHWQPAHPLKERILMLKQPLPGRARAALGATLVAVLSLGAGVAAWAAQPATKPAVPPATADVSYSRLAPPAYPADAKAQGVAGTVMLRVLVGEDGAPARVEVETSAGDARLDAAAVAKVREWHFNPRLVDGKPAEQWVQVPVTFSLDGPPGEDEAVPAAANRLDEIYISPKQ